MLARNDYSIPLELQKPVKGDKRWQMRLFVDDLSGTN
jgi:hypothetical protein